MAGSCRCMLPFLAALLFLMAAPCRAGTVDWMRTAWHWLAARGGAAAPPTALAGPVCCKTITLHWLHSLLMALVCVRVLGLWQFVSLVLITKPTNTHRCL